MVSIVLTSDQIPQINIPKLSMRRQIMYLFSDKSTQQEEEEKSEETDMTVELIIEHYQSD